MQSEFTLFWSVISVLDELWQELLEMADGLSCLLRVSLDSSRKLGCCSAMKWITGLEGRIGVRPFRHTITRPWPCILYMSPHTSSILRLMPPRGAVLLIACQHSSPKMYEIVP